MLISNDMRQVHFLIAAEECITLSSRFYKIVCGGTAKDEEDLAYINLYAAIKNFYFEKYDAAVAKFLENVAQSLNVTTLDLQIIHISARELVSYMENFGTLPERPALTKNQCRVMELFKPQSYFQRQINVIRQAEAKQRKKPKAHNGEPSGLN